jgi:membrane-associated phospholipid phosphatase
MPMSNENTGHALPHDPAEAAVAVRQEARFGAAFLRRHGWRLALVFAGVLLPLWGFGELAAELRGDGFSFDEPLLRLAQRMTFTGLDHAALLFSSLGYLWLVVPADVLLVVGLALKRWYRESVFAAVAIAGSALLNLGAKQIYGRARPELWEPLVTEHSLSFPSGHAMGSMTLAWVAILLAWRTRRRWLVLALGLLFTLLVGMSRIYLGVHYPSDVLAGWIAAIVWVGGVFLVAFHGGRKPWQRSTPQDA